MKNQRETVKFCKFIYQFAELKRILPREIDSINKMMEQDERSRKVKSSFQKLQETKTKLDRAYENACGLLKAESVGSLSIFEKDNKEFSLKKQQTTTDSLNNVDRSKEEKNQWNEPTTANGLEGIFSHKDIPVTTLTKKTVSHGI